MAALDLLEQRRGKALYTVHLDLLRRILDAQRSTITQPEAVNLELSLRNNRLQERLQRYATRATGFRSPNTHQ